MAFLQEFSLRLAMSLYVGALLWEGITLSIAFLSLPSPYAVLYLAFQVDSRPTSTTACLYLSQAVLLQTAGQSV